MTENHPTIRLQLPQLAYGPFRTPIGSIHCVLRNAETVDAVCVGEVHISPKVKEPLYELASGEKLIVTTRKQAERPPETHGVLWNDGMRLTWLKHASRDNFDAEVRINGWNATVRSRAMGWEGRFAFRAEAPDVHGTIPADKRGLRPPQLGALHAIGSHWSLYNTPATIVMPTGTGKTETMLSTLVAYIRKPMLVIVPSDALRSQTARKFLTLGLLRWLNVLDLDALNPIVGVINKVPKTFDALEMFEQCNVLIGTMDSLADSAAEHLWPEVAKRTGILVIDEAHHIGAKRWSKFREAFGGIPILQFTATPFRRDGNLVDGAVIYTYPLGRAQKDGYFKPIKFEPVYEPVPAKADRTIAEAALARLRADLEAGLNHLMMARCSDIERADAVHAIYNEMAPDLKPLLVHSKLAGAHASIEALREGRSRIVVCVNMLGEGFDLPELKVAAIHDLHKSLAILLQFTGRFTRSAAKEIGDATVVANIAEPNVSAALERLYGEDADWNELLSEMSSEAVQEHARLVAFLNEARRIDQNTDADDETSISHKLLRPTLSTLVYRCENFLPKRFHKGLPDLFVPHRVWMHAPSNTLFFVTRSQPSVKWSRSKAVQDLTWNLFILHHDAPRNLLYLSSTDHDSNFEKLAEAVGAGKLVSGETVFRSMGRINRLIFQNLGVKKVGRRNLSYASYTGSEVTEALTAAEKAGSRKAMLSGNGWEQGKQVTIGCSAKGRVWSREQGSVPRFNEWCEHIGDKINDETIDPSSLIQHVLLPTVVDRLPDAELLTIEWPIEMLRQAEERIVFSDGKREGSQVTFELRLLAVDRERNAIEFGLDEAMMGRWGMFQFRLGGPDEFKVKQIDEPTVRVAIGKIDTTLEEYFSDYPPLFRFVDLSELDANLHIVPQSPYELELRDDQIEVWRWDGVDITKESIWKGDEKRENSIQGHVAERYVEAGFDVVFDDDASGEAADLVCMKQRDDHIQLVLVHCKFSGGDTPGERVKDVVEVSSQAVRSARWTYKFVPLCQHIKAREGSLATEARPSRFLKGSLPDLNRLIKFHRFNPMRAEIVVVQPGLSKARRTKDQSIVLAAALTYLKETVGIDLGIISGE